MGSETQNFVLVWTLTFLALGERVRGRGEGGAGLEVPGLILNFPQFKTFVKSIRECLRLSVTWLLTLTFLGQPCLH